eukprot:scaffold42629_cov55-Phaeocystis_antarctica.AAC.5
MGDASSYTAQRQVLLVDIKPNPNLNSNPNPNPNPNQGRFEAEDEKRGEAKAQEEEEAARQMERAAAWSKCSHSPGSPSACPGLERRALAAWVPARRPRRRSGACPRPLILLRLTTQVRPRPTRTTCGPPSSTLSLARPSITPTLTRSAEAANLTPT